MVEGFWEGLKDHALRWLSLVFTVGGTFVSLLVMREHWWLSLLFVAASYLALGTYAHELWQKRREVEARHQAEEERLRAERQEAIRKMEEAERKLNEVPAGILADLQRVLVAHSFAELARLLAARADFVGRMTKFSQGSTKPISLRTFTKQADGLYAFAKVEPEALAYVRAGDPFLLVRRAVNGVETESARLVVHQLPAPGKDVLIFRIADFLSDELGHIDRLAESGDVEGMKGYRVQVACDTSRYENLDLRHLAAAVRALVEEMTTMAGKANG